MRSLSELKIKLFADGQAAHRSRQRKLIRCASAQLFLKHYQNGSI